MKMQIFLVMLIIFSYGVNQERIKEIMSKATGYTEGIQTISFVHAKYSMLGGLYAPKTVWIYDQGESTDTLAYYLSHEYGHHYCWSKLRMWTDMWTWGNDAEFCANAVMKHYQ